jgi:hypothetical protein
VDSESPGAEDPHAARKGDCGADQHSWRRRCAVDYHVTFWKAEVIDFVMLQQDAFDDVDAVTSLERQEEILNLVTLSATTTSTSAISMK